MSRFSCTVIGDVFIDIAVKTSSGQEPFCSGGTSYTDCAKADMGGSGNIATALSFLGERTAFVGRAGNDFLGKLYLQNLLRQEVVSHISFDKAFPTGLLIAFVDGKERSFLVFRGANDRFSILDIRKAATAIRNSEYVYFSGYSLVNDPQESAILGGVEFSKSLKKKIVFDPGAHNLVRSKHHMFSEIVDLCDILTLNVDEAIAVTKTTNREQIINKLKGRAPLVALKCGKDGCVMITDEKTIMVPSYRVKCRDTTGAGDAFAAALIHGLARGLPLEAIGQLANWFAAKVVTQIGPRSYPMKSETNRFLTGLVEINASART